MAVAQKGDWVRALLAAQPEHRRERAFSLPFSLSLSLSLARESHTNDYRLFAGEFSMAPQELLTEAFAFSPLVPIVFLP